MTRRDRIHWWIYAIATVVLWFFFGPYLVSAADTVMVLAAVVLIVLYGVWSWELWVKRFIQIIQERLNEDD